MAQPRLNARKTSTSNSRARDARRLFFKADHPRGIDRYIDYFGGAGSVAAADDDLCGETLLERLA
jgi:hypothetical protein